MSRYACQLRLRSWGATGQARVGASRVALVGLGATGSALAESLTRAGVGELRLIDRDVLELSNLSRQVLYTEADVRAGLPKAEAARRRLSELNSEVELRAEISDFEARNALQLLEGADLVLDGTDNFATRFVLNDACLELGVPWIYTGIVGTQVHTMNLLGAGSPCFRCYVPEPPPPGSVETCESAGVLNASVLLGAGLAASEALKLLAGGRAEAVPGLFMIDAWTREARCVQVPRDPDCPACRGERSFLRAGPAHAELCGQDAVAVRAAPGTELDLGRLAGRLEELGQVLLSNAFLLRFQPQSTSELTLTLFRDGRALVKGTRDPGEARTLVARYLG